MEPAALSLQVALGLLALAAGVIDMRTRRIPNWLTGSGFCAGVGLHAALQGWTGVRQALAGAGLGLGIYFLMFALRAMGAGDVKLMGAVGALTGPHEWMWIFLASSLWSGVAAFALLATRGNLLPTLWNVLTVLGSLARFRAPYRINPALDVGHAKAVTVPHGACIALGCLLYLCVNGLR